MATFTPAPTIQLGAPHWRTSSVSCLFKEPPNRVKIDGDGTTRSVLTHHAKLHPQEITFLLENESQRARSVFMHAMWDVADSRWLDQWIGLAMEREDFHQIIAHRLAQDPSDGFTRYVLLETLQGDEKETCAEDLRRLADENPDDGDAQYFALISQVAGPERDAAIMKEFEKFPDNNWFKSNSAYIDARVEKWEDAEKTFGEVVRARGPWFTSAAMTCARIRRLLSETEAPSYHGLQDSIELRRLRTIEEMDYNIDQSPFLAYSMLADGKLEDALQRVKGSDAAPGVTVLVAASQDATEQWQEAGLSVPMETLTQSSKLYLAALAARMGKPFEKYLDAHREDDPSTKISAADCLGRIIDEGPRHFADAGLNGLNPEERGIVMAASAVYSPGETSAKWKRDAKRLLFCVERPWFESED